jgi:calcium-dependent protein kinase
VTRKLGEGAFGSVYEVLHRTLGLRRALKIIRNNKTSSYPSKE